MEARKRSSYSYMYIILSIFIFTFCIGNVNAAVYENYYGIEMTNEEYNNLLNLGFTDHEIYLMNEETFEENKDIEATLIAKTNKYYKTTYTDLNGTPYTMEITENEYNNQSQMNQRGTVNTEYKNMISTIARLDNSFRYKVTVGWTNIPSTRSYDIIGIGFADDVYISSLVNFSYSYANSNGDWTTSTLNYGKHKISTGGSAVYKVPSGDIRGLSAVLYYDVSKINSSQTITYLEMCGDYAHATTSISQSRANDHDTGIYGIDVFSNVNYFDEIPCALSVWGGTW